MLFHLTKVHFKYHSIPLIFCGFLTRFSNNQTNSRPHSLTGQLSSSVPSTGVFNTVVYVVIFKKFNYLLIIPVRMMFYS